MPLIIQTNEMFQQLEQSRIYKQVNECQHCQATYLLMYYCIQILLYQWAPGRCWHHGCVSHLAAFVPYHPMHDTSKSCLHLLCGLVALSQLWISLLIHSSRDHSQNIVPCVIPLIHRGRGKEQGRAPRCTGMVGSSRSHKNSPLFMVCISGVEGRARFQASWHP